VRKWWTFYGGEDENVTLLEISPDPSFPERGIPPFRKGGRRDLVFSVHTIMD
jgi:hypothetical protein